MELSDQLISFEQAKKLKKMIGVLEHHYSWYEISRCSNLHETIIPILHRKGEFWGGYGSKIAEYPAYTVAELGVLLPGLIQTDEDDYFYYSEKTIGGQHICGYSIPSNDNFLGRWQEQNESHAKSDCLIWLIENGYVNPKELKL